MKIHSQICKIFVFVTFCLTEMRAQLSKKVTVRDAEETRELIREFMGFEICHVNRVQQEEPEMEHPNPELKKALRQIPFPRELEDAYIEDDDGKAIASVIYVPGIMETIDADELHLEENETDVDDSLPRRTKKKEEFYEYYKEVYNGLSDDELSNSEEEDFSDGRSVYSDDYDRPLDDYDEYDW